MLNGECRVLNVGCPLRAADLPGSGPPGKISLSACASPFFIFSRQGAKGVKNISFNLYLTPLFVNVYLTLYMQTDFVLLIELLSHLFMTECEIWISQSCYLLR